MRRIVKKYPLRFKKGKNGVFGFRVISGSVKSNGAFNDFTIHVFSANPSLDVVAVFNVAISGITKFEVEGLGVGKYLIMARDKSRTKNAVAADNVNADMPIFGFKLIIPEGW